MAAIFRFAYSLAVAILFILFAIFATRVLFDEPRGFTDAIEDERKEHFRNVFLVSGALGVMAIAAGAALFRRIDAIPLGLVLGGIGTLVFGWVEWSRGPEEGGTGFAFVAVSIGLALVLGGGYWFLGRGDEKPHESADASSGG